jgi:tetraacyldisaccharide 4'-kinase
VPLDEPTWWYGPAGSTQARLLAPVARIWARVAEHRWHRTTPYRSTLPVICVGNFTAGGTGKTPVAATIADLLRQLGRTPVILSRGYGGRLRGPHWVDPERDTARDVGDEPLLHAARGPVVIARDRAAGALFIEARRIVSDVIVMDDGLQNPSLVKDFAIAVIDGKRGLGNARVIPAGPLRADLEFQLGLVDAIVIVGGGSVDPKLREQFGGHFSKAVLTARVAPVALLDWLTDGPVVAWAGIGAPARFFDMLRANGAHVVGEVAFPDHHMPSAVQARRLLQDARAHRATLVTTEKDAARVRASQGDVGSLAAASRPVRIELNFSADDRARLATLVEKALARAP